MTVEVISFGCRLNAAESEAMRRAAEGAGLTDIVVVNTCAVTGEAVRQARQAVRRARRENPAARIVVTGCAAQTEPATFAAMAEVDLVLGNGDKTRPERWQRLADLGFADSERVQVDDIASVRDTAGHLAAGFQDRARAFVQVQNGCDHRCTFCIIPYGRGPARSVPAGAVVDSIREVVAAGRQEVVLTGVDLTSWGQDLPGRPRLGSLVRAILRQVPDLPRLRLSSIDGAEVDEALVDLLGSEPRLMPHVHLSLQSGDDLVLKRMKRRHSRADAIRLCADLRRRRPDLVLGADFIAGFPTETESMFRNTLDLVETCGLTWLHVFPFSPRRGTPAARMPQVDRGLVQDRAARLRAAAERAEARFLAGEVGARRRVLVERPGRGRTEHFAEVELGGGTTAAGPGTLIDVVVTGVSGRRLLAEAA